MKKFEKTIDERFRLESGDFADWEKKNRDAISAEIKPAVSAAGGSFAVSAQNGGGQATVCKESCVVKQDTGGGIASETDAASAAAGDKSAPIVATDNSGLTMATDNSAPTVAEKEAFAEAQEKDSAAQPVTAKKRKRLSTPWQKGLIAAACAVLLVVASVLITKGAVRPPIDPVPSPTINYNDSDVKSRNMTDEEIAEMQALFPILKQCLPDYSSYLTSYWVDTGTAVSKVINTFLMAGDDEFYELKIVRLLDPTYNYIDKSRFTNLPNKTEINGTKIEYKEESGGDGQSQNYFIKAEKDGIVTYWTVEAMDGDIENFLSMAFS